MLRNLHVFYTGLYSHFEETVYLTTTAMSDGRPWSTKRKMKERSARLLAAKRARGSAGSSQVAVSLSCAEHDTLTLTSA